MKTLIPTLTGLGLASLFSACGLAEHSSQGSSGASGVSPSGGSGGSALVVAAGNSSGGAGAAAGSVLSNGGASNDALGGNGGATSAGVAGSSAGAVPMPPSELVISSPDRYWQTAPLTAVTINPDVIVDHRTTYQTFDGFGGTFNELSWIYLEQLSEAERARALSLLFGADGARFAFGQLPIGANEYAQSRYTLDDTESDSTPDLQLEKFSLSRDSMRLIPFVQAALALKPDLRFLAVPWTPPVWMKVGPFWTSAGGSVGSGYDGGNMREDPATLQAFALYLTKFVQEYEKQGIAIESVAVQREPSFAEPFPSCRWSSAAYLKFVGDYLEPTLRAHGLSTKIYLGHMENGEETSIDTEIVSKVAKDPALLKSFSGFGFQWGMFKQMPRVTGLALPIMQTEHQPGNEPVLAAFNPNNAPNDYAYAIESWGLIRRWLEAGATAYIIKHMVLDRVGIGLSRTWWPQNALLAISPNTRTLTVTPAYYVVDHFSHFIAPGAKRVDVTSGNVEALAFENPDGSIATIMYNPSSGSVPVTIAVGGARYQLTLPASGFATLLKGS